MFARFLLAFVGASTITLGLLYGMNEIVKIFQRRDATQYFMITDVLLQPEGQRPRRPPRAAEQPDRGPLPFERPEVSLDVDRPDVELEDSPEAPSIRPRLEDPRDERR